MYYYLMGFIKKAIVYSLSILILVIGVVIYNEVEFNIKVIDLPPEANAKCLDGSNYRFQFVSGSGDGIDKFLIYFEGGGLCGGKAGIRSTIESCRRRALKPFGQQIGKFAVTISRLNNLFSNKKERNPLFHNWNKINVHYCDGLLHVSNVDRDGLYIRGLNNTIGIIDYLEKHNNFKNAASVVISGFSAGGMASLYYANYIESRSIKQQNTFVISDSGYLLDVAEKTGQTHNFPPILSQAITYTGNNDDLLKTFCPFQNDNERWKCIAPEHIISNVTVPILLLQNLYDSWMIDRLGEINCFYSRQFTNNCSAEEMKSLKKYADYTLEKITDLVTKKENISAWLPNTIGHVFTFSTNIFQNKKYAVNDITLMDMITTWYEQVSQGKIIPFDKKLVTTTSEHNLHEYKDFLFYSYVYKLFEIAGFHY